MGNNEEGKSSKSDKSSSPVPQDQTNIHVYPDWAAMQAYYGPQMTLPPYYNSPVASGHTPPPYMWGPQPMMPPYGAPYAAIYSHGGVYAHPAVPLASHSHGQTFPSSPPVAAPLSIETPSKSGNSDRGLMKKLKGFDGIAMSIGNGTARNAEDGAEHKPSQSGETDGSSDGSDGNTTGMTDQTRRKRSKEGTPTIGNGKKETKSEPVPAGEASAPSDKVLNVATSSGKSIATGLSPGMTTELELRNPPSMNAKSSPTSIPQPCSVLPPEVWLQNEREIKRERRKQSNRESARRSRLRKQAENEELAHKVESLSTENMALKSEVNQLTEKSEKLRLENSMLAEKLKSSQFGYTEDIILKNVNEKRAAPVSTENLLSRVSNSGSVDGNLIEEGDMHDEKSNSGTKLHQLLDASPRADAVAAG
ncbi:hypothetical protein SLEP1_g9932 [Rubroshorea leprosula]|uniref:BZIP domain-containing protein n=1 Tax=Rubroshorea leprosula TaxID=152421 RepID=A0AAV5IHT3_9ROSI|nr:hypothetical protein SLEP1_g9932 [Rubroshorea leprosula]